MCRRKKQEEQSTLWKAVGARTTRSRCRSKGPRSSDKSHCFTHKAFVNVQLMAVWNCVISFEFPVPLVRMQCGYAAHQRRVGFEGSTAAPVQTYAVMLPRSKFSVVLMRLVMQDAMRVVLCVWPKVRIKDNLDDKKSHVQVQKAVEATGAARIVYEVLKKQIQNPKFRQMKKGKIRTNKVLRKSRWRMMRDMNTFCKAAGLRLTHSAEFSEERR